MPETVSPNGPSKNSDMPDTMPKILLHNARVMKDKSAMREKDLGIWQAWTWSEMAVEIRMLACGLAAKGFARNDKIAIIGDNRARLYWAMAAAQCLGGIPVPLYQDSVADEMAIILEDADVRFAIVEDQEQVDKMVDIKEQTPLLETIIYCDPKGLYNYEQPYLNDYETIVAAGREFDRQNPDYFMQEVEKGSGSDVAIFLFTSGTTGKPKGVVLTHDNIVIVSRSSLKFDDITANDEIVSYLPMGWVGDNLFSFAQSYVSGYCVNCPESQETVLTDLREIGPTYYFAPPAVWENLLTQIMIRMEDSPWLLKKIFHYFLAVAKRSGVKILNKEPVSLKERLLYGLGWLLVYGPLKNTLGFSRIRLAYTAGEAIGPDLFEFFRSLGINIKQLYGQTEAYVYICMQPNGQVYADTVGVPAPEGVEVKVTDSGEVIYRSPGVFHSYYKNPESTADTKNAEGWVMTGDAGFFTEQGHLKIIDRVKDVGKMKNGAMFAPKYIENKLKFFPYIKEVVSFGDGREYVTAFISIDMNAVGDWAERRNISYSGYPSLAAQEPVYELIKECIEKTNRDLAGDKQLCHSQIKRFLLLHKELDADDGELTRTRKVRRKFINQKYPILIDALFSDEEHCSFEAEVRYEDGRIGSIQADLKIWETKIIEPQAAGEVQ
ncbi:MAG: AMP-binding protein [SAR324 cluster bacterium]|nr:AMP-binding protein [SAR324 cluster bacterium]